jgi:hypothetical protein
VYFDVGERVGSLERINHALRKKLISRYSCGFRRRNYE